MSYGEKRKPNLDTILPEYQKISDAPKENDDPKRRYKSLDRDGNVWLIQNPACWKLVAIDGQSSSGIRYRAEPKMVMTSAEGLAAASSGPANKVSIGWGGI